MEYAGQHGRERTANLFKVVERQVRAIELPVVQLAANDFANQRVDFLGIRIRQRARRRLDAVRHHDHRGFARLRARALVAECRNVHLIAIELQRLIIEEHHRTIAVVLANNIDHRLRNARLLRHRRAVARMRGQNRSGYAGIGAVVRIIAHLVFLKIHRPLEFADIMVIRADAGEQSVRADR